VVLFFFFFGIKPLGVVGRVITGVCKEGAAFDECLIRSGVRTGGGGEGVVSK